MKKKIIIIASICFVVCICVVALVFALKPSDPPEYSEVKDRFEELVLASAVVNKIFYGEGLPTYERVVDPYSTVDTYTSTKVDADGNEVEIRYYYYELNDKEFGRVIGYRSSFLDDFTYARILSAPDENKTPLYFDQGDEIYVYLLDGYTPPEYEFFYDDSDPDNYDYVRFDCEINDEKIQNIKDIKKLAESVYSSDFLSDAYVPMFEGMEAAAGNVSALKPRYIEYTDEEDATPYLMMENSGDYVLVKETRVFDFDTAKIVKGSTADYLYIEVETYLPSNPNDRLTDTFSMIKENGVWMLDSATY